MIKKLFPALLLSILATSANATVIDYTMTISNSASASGQFSGADGNADGFLSLNELSAFAFDIPVAGYHFELDRVSDFGRYNIAANTWLHDAAGWSQTNFAYVSFDGGALSVNTFNASNVLTSVAQAPADVPEPASVTLTALGLLALRAARRSKK